MDYRIEHDSMGEVKVPADKYWAAQTQRSHENFEIGIGIETMPREITQAFGILKKAAAIANNKLSRIGIEWLLNFLIQINLISNQNLTFHCTII